MDTLRKLRSRNLFLATSLCTYTFRARERQTNRQIERARDGHTDRATERESDDTIMHDSICRYIIIMTCIVVRRGGLTTSETCRGESKCFAFAFPDRFYQRTQWWLAFGESPAWACLYSLAIVDRSSLGTCTFCNDLWLWVLFVKCETINLKW